MYGDYIAHEDLAGYGDYIAHSNLIVYGDYIAGRPVTSSGGNGSPN